MAVVKEINYLPERIQQIINAGASTKTKGQSQRAFGRYRVSTLVTSTRALEENDANGIIKCWVNPSEMNWTLPQRGALQKVRGGTIRYLWRNRERKTFFDEFKVTISFASGNILPQERVSAYALSDNFDEIFYESSSRMKTATFAAADKEGGAAVTPPGLDNLYQFFSLLDEDPLTKTGRDNLHLIFHTSAVFPAILLKGYFDPAAGVTFTESAEGAWEVKWSAPFEILHTTPKITDLNGLRRIYGLIAL